MYSVFFLWLILLEDATERINKIRLCEEYGVFIDLTPCFFVHLRDYFIIGIEVIDR